MRTEIGKCDAVNSITLIRLGTVIKKKKKN